MTTNTELNQEVSDQNHLFAAIDLGSNSFHMIIARLVHGEVRVLEKMGEKVQLASGLDEHQNISQEAQDRALECLSRFAQRLKGIEKSAVRLVATNTLRVAKNAAQFKRKIESMLEIPMEVIAGQEEARLIYLGVAHTLADDSGRRLVMDIGGGSTEFIIGERFEAKELESLHMGCVSYREQFFADGEITEVQFNKAVTAASRELLNIRDNYLRMGWQEAVGASGSIKAVANVLSELDICHDGITRSGLMELKKRVISLGNSANLDQLGVRKERLGVFPSGLAILCASFEVLAIDVMHYSDGALREGVLYDMLGRIQHEDVRERTIQALAERYHLDQNHASTVERTAMMAYQQVKRDWGISAPYYSDLLRWAARLHEIGLTISHSQYHKHGAYLLEHSYLPGFSKQVQKNLAVLVRCHRRKLLPLLFQDYSPEEAEPMMRLTLLLRLAVLLRHERTGDVLAEFWLNVNRKQITIEFAEEWLQAHPLTLADLEMEADYLSKMEFKLEVVTRPAE
ncbi:MAG: exopolyphosphatase [Pseudomonadales bacterium]|nr:exopolyphosphatase [Pseudomonadales bacterium]